MGIINWTAENASRIRYPNQKNAKAKAAAVSCTQFRVDKRIHFIKSFNGDETSKIFTLSEINFVTITSHHNIRVKNTSQRIIISVLKITLQVQKLKNENTAH